jgi:hypothetical protein
MIGRTPPGGHDPLRSPIPKSARICLNRSQPHMIFEIDMFGSHRLLLRRIGLICFLLILFLTPIIARGLIEASSSLDNAQRLLEQRSFPEAITELRRAVEWRGLGLSAPRKAEQLLRELAEDRALSIDSRRSALENLKSGLRGSRSWLHPSSYADPQSDVSILKQKLLADTPDGGPARAILSPRFDVNYGWQLSAQITFWGWVLSLAYLAFSSVTREGAAARRSWGAPIALVGACYALWLVSLRFV